MILWGLQYRGPHFFYGRYMMQELQWMLELKDSATIILREDVAEELGVDLVTKVGEIRELIQPKQIEEKQMIEIEDDLNMEL